MGQDDMTGTSTHLSTHVSTLVVGCLRLLHCGSSYSSGATLTKRLHHSPVYASFEPICRHMCRRATYSSIKIISPVYPVYSSSLRKRRKIEIKRQRKKRAREGRHVDFPLNPTRGTLMPNDQSNPRRDKLRHADDERKVVG